MHFLNLLQVHFANFFGLGKWETWIICDQICVSYFKNIGWYFLSDKAKYHLYFTIVHFLPPLWLLQAIILAKNLSKGVY